MTNIFSLDIGSFFGKKDDATKLDNDALALIANTPVMTMRGNATAEKKVFFKPSIATPPNTSQENQLPSYSQSTQGANPFDSTFSEGGIAPALPIQNKPINNNIPAAAAPIQEQPMQINPQPEAPTEEDSSIINNDPLEYSKNKYPAYANPSDEEVATKMLAKFPQYENQIDSEETIPKIPQKENFSVETQLPIEKSTNGRKIAIAISLLVILILAGGGYYFWTINQKPAEEIIIPGEIILPEQPPVIETPIVIPEKPPVEETNPRYMNFDFTNATPAQRGETLNKYITEAKISGTKELQEFIVTDLQNNPIGFFEFSTKMGINFSPEIFSYLGNEFSFFIYNDIPNARIGLAIKTKNDTALKTAIQSFEKNLVSALNPLLLTKPAGEIDKNSIIFSDNIYKQVNIRYFNIPASNGLSVDYAIDKGNLVFGTSMMTFRSLIDTLEESNNNSTVSIPDTDTVLP